MRILLDMNLSPQLRPALERNGFQCVHWSEVGDPGATDKKIMEWAAQNGCSVLTHDLDFGAILAAVPARAPSVIQVRTQDLLAPALESLIVRVLKEFSAEIEAGCLIVVDEHKSRVRLLPLKT